MSEYTNNQKDYPGLNWSKSELNKDQKELKKFDDKKKKEILKMRKRQYREELETIKSEYRDPPKKHFTTTKILMYLIFLNCFVIEVYSMWVMYALKDLSALYSLIGAVIGESLSFAIYCAKSFKESKEEAIISLERDKLSDNINNELDKTQNSEQNIFITEDNR